MTRVFRQWCYIVSSGRILTYELTPDEIQSVSERNVVRQLFVLDFVASTLLLCISQVRKSIWIYPTFPFSPPSLFHSRWNVHLVSFRVSPCSDLRNVNDDDDNRMHEIWILSDETKWGKTKIVSHDAVWWEGQDKCYCYYQSLFIFIPEKNMLFSSFPLCLFAKLKCLDLKRTLPLCIILF